MNIKYEVKQANSSLDPLQSDAPQVLLVETRPSTAGEGIQDYLVANYFNLLANLDSTDNLVNQTAEFMPDVLVLSVDQLDPAALESLIHINQRAPLPVVVLAEREAPQGVQIVVNAGVDCYVVDNVQPHRIPTIIDLAIVRFNKEKGLNKELQDVRQKLEDRKLIEKAKGILMQERQLNEDQAYQQMRKMAMDRGRPMAVLAERIISAFEMLNRTAAT